MRIDYMNQQIAAISLATVKKRAEIMFQALPAVVHELGQMFQAAGFELALVGGPVRDALMGRSSDDLDFSTSAKPEQTEEILRAWIAEHGTLWQIGKDFGTLGAQKAGVKVEITTYRSEEYDLNSRKPQVAYGDSLIGDLSRRDFTINSMAVKLPSLEFVDPFNGLADLAAATLRTPVDPKQSFSDDPLRMMRAVRFKSTLGFEIEAQTAAAILQLADRLAIVSAERVRDELVKLILGANPRQGLEAMVELGLAELVLPELPALQLEIDEHHRHKDVYAHTLTVLEQAIDLETDAAGAVPGPDFILRFAALMHDVGKPETRRFEAGGVVTFRFHEVVGARMSTKRMKALKFDKETIKAVSKLVELHLRFHGYADAGWSDSAVRRYVTDAGEQLERLHRLTRADCTTRNQRKAKWLSAAYDDLEKRIQELSKQEEINRIRPDLDGEAIMQILDLQPGPKVGQAYRFLLDLRMEEGPLGQAEAKERLLNWWRNQED